MIFSYTKRVRTRMWCSSIGQSLGGHGPLLDGADLGPQQAEGHHGSDQRPIKSGDENISFTRSQSNWSRVIYWDWISRSNINFVNPIMHLSMQSPTTPSRDRGGFVNYEVQRTLPRGYFIWQTPKKPQGMTVKHNNNCNTLVYRQTAMIYWLYKVPTPRANKAPTKPPLSLEGG